MNRIHRTVWSKARNALVVVAEVTTSQCKGAKGGSVRAAGRRSRGGAPGMSGAVNALGRLGQSLAVAGLVTALPMAHALPQNGQVTSGSATIAQGVGITSIAQTSQNASLNWSSFNVGSGERVVFAQPNASAIALNRIADTSASQILGTLRANGQVFLINPNGIVFGAGAQVSVGALVASTLDVADSALAQTIKTFSGAATGGITNLGTIAAAPGGYVALIGNQVSNQGSLQAPGGTVALGAGAQVTLRFADNQLLGMTVDRNTLGNLVDNQQLIQADGGQVILSAGARDNVLAGVVNNSGRLQARTLQDVGGVITLSGGQVQQLGTLDASAPTSGNAGSVRVDGTSVLDGGQIDASSAAGQGGQVSMNAVGGLIQTGQARVSVDGAAQGGHIALQANNVFTSATLNAKGSGAAAHGGTIDVLATNQAALQGSLLDASGSGSDTGGLIRVGGDFHGANANVINAATTLVNGASTLRTDGASAQGGGRVVIWSDAKTAYLGAIEARGGEVEVSSRDVLQFAGDVKARQLLLDPKNIVILSGASASASASAAAFALVDPNPSAGRLFGYNTTVLGSTIAGVFAPNDRAVIAVSSDNASRGAVYLYNTATGALVSTLTGSQANDRVGSGGVTALTNGNFVVSSNWANGSAANAGAATWGSGTAGVSGAVSASNSLVGSQAGDYVGNAITPLTNGSYVVSSYNWAKGTAANAGAATWGSGTAGVSGAVSASNSLVGSQANDVVGFNVTALTNGNYLVSSPYWANAGATNAGAATWGSGTAGVSGAVSVSNSLVGSQADDYVGNFVITHSAFGFDGQVRSSNWTNWANRGERGAGQTVWGSCTTGASCAESARNYWLGSLTNGVTALTNGNYVVLSSVWSSGKGAVTWGSGTGGVSGAVSASNSLVGSKFYDYVGLDGGVTALVNGSYVVRSPHWANGGAYSAGAATWGSGTAGVSGAVSASNSLVGSQANDQVGSGGVTALTNGNYVVSIGNWANGGATYAGAATWGSGTAGISGAVSGSNSLVGIHSSDYVGRRVTALTNGNYVVSNGIASGSGSATWGSGTAGVSGAVSASNSLVGSRANDAVGSSGITALTNGNYVVSSNEWANGGAIYAGAATWGSGTAGVSGAVSASNSLVGSQANDQVGSGGVTALTNGTYLLSSPYWANAGATNAGAATWVSGAAVVSGAVSASNSLVGSHSYDALGSGGVRVLPHGGFIASNPFFNASAGQVQFMSTPTGTQGASNQFFSNLGGLDVYLDPVNLQKLLANGTAVTLQASTDLTVASPINVAGITGGALTLQAGRSILFNANVTTANGNLTAVANDPGAVAAQRDAGSGNIVIANGVNLNVGTGTATLVGQAFVNNSGAGALQTTGMGSWAVWSADPAKDTRGGLAYDFKQYNASYVNQTLVQAAGNGFLYSLSPTITASLTSSLNKVYDASTAVWLVNAGYNNAGGANQTLVQGAGNRFLYSNSPLVIWTGSGINVSGSPWFGGVSYITAGAVDGDIVALNPYVTNIRFNTKGVGTGKTVVVTGLTLGDVFNGAAPVYGYALASSASGAIGNITPANLAVTGVKSIDRFYDATTVDVLGGTAVVTPLARDTVTVSGPGTGLFADKAVGNFKPVTVTGYTLGGPDAANYVVVQPIGLTASIKASVVPPLPQALSRSAKGPTPGAGGTDIPGASLTTGFTSMDAKFVTDSDAEPQK